jgi:hypothetical protein
MGYMKMIYERFQSKNVAKFAAKMKIIIHMYIYTYCRDQCSARKWKDTQILLLQPPSLLGMYLPRYVNTHESQSSHFVISKALSTNS